MEAKRRTARAPVVRIFAEHRILSTGVLANYTPVTDEGDIIHHSKGPKWMATDGSYVTGTVVQKVPAPAEDAIPWLLLSATPGGTDDGMLCDVTFIQRVYTKHGNAPSDGCDADDAGTETPVFYEAECYFYVPRD